MLLFFPPISSLSVSLLNSRGRKEMWRNSQVNNEMHRFVVDYQEHPKIIEIHAELKRLSGIMHNARYVQCTLCCMMWKKRKRCFICGTVVRNWLLHFDSSTKLLVVQSKWWKNMQVCEDCHTSTKLIPEIVGRAIMVRDADCFITLRMVFVPCMDDWRCQ